jgi:hypothetical protein
LINLDFAVSFETIEYICENLIYAVGLVLRTFCTVSITLHFKCHSPIFGPPIRQTHEDKLQAMRVSLILSQFPKPQRLASFKHAQAKVTSAIFVKLFP